jgi:hypothetical protein
VFVGVGSGSVLAGGSVSTTGATGAQEDRIITKRMTIKRPRMIFIMENSYHLIKPGQKPGAKKLLRLSYIIMLSHKIYWHTFDQPSTKWSCEHD